MPDKDEIIRIGKKCKCCGHIEWIEVSQEEQNDTPKNESSLQK